jgi:hypothetical protein
LCRLAQARKNYHEHGSRENMCTCICWIQKIKAKFNIVLLHFKPCAFPRMLYLFVTGRGVQVLDPMYTTETKVIISNAPMENLAASRAASEKPLPRVCH